MQWAMTDVVIMKQNMGVCIFPGDQSDNLDAYEDINLESSQTCVLKAHINFAEMTECTTPITVSPQPVDATRLPHTPIMLDSSTVETKLKQKLKTSTSSEIFLNKFSKHEHQIDTLQTAYTKLLEETAVNNENVDNKIDNCLKSVKEMFHKINEKMITKEYIARKLNEETTTIEKCIIDNLNTTKAETEIINNLKDENNKMKERLTSLKHEKSNCEKKCQEHKMEIRRLKGIITEIKKDKTPTEQVTVDREIEQYMSESHSENNDDYVPDRNLEDETPTEPKQYKFRRSNTPQMYQPVQNTEDSRPIPSDIKVIMSCDSIPKHVDANKLCGYRSTKIIRSGSMAKACELAVNWPPSSELEVFITHQGVRDALDGVTSKQLTLDSKHLMREAERKFSNARIAFSEILHVGNNTNSNVNITIDEVNNEMVRYCQSNDKYVFIGHKMLQQRDDLYEDHCHINRDGTRVFVADIHRHLRPTSQNSTRDGQQRHTEHKPYGRPRQSPSMNTGTGSNNIKSLIDILVTGLRSAADDYA